jgi:hypothetical protein
MRLMIDPGAIDGEHVGAAQALRVLCGDDGAHARAADEINRHAGFFERPNDADVSEPPRTTAAEHQPDSAAAQMTSQALEIRCAIRPYMVVPRERPESQPLPRSQWRPAVSQEHELFARDSRREAICPPGLALGLREGGVVGREVKHAVGLPQATTRPGGRLRVGLVHEEAVLRFLRVEPSHESVVAMIVLGKLCGSSPQVRVEGTGVDERRGGNV